MILKVLKRVADTPDSTLDSWVFFEADEIHMAGRPVPFSVAKTEMDDEEACQCTEVVYDHRDTSRVLVAMLRGHGDQIPRYVVFDQAAYLMNARGDTVEKFRVRDFTPPQQ